MNLRAASDKNPSVMRSSSKFLWAAFFSAFVPACSSDVEVTEGVPCGPVTCGVAEYCCDAACGLCLEEEVACTETCPES